MTIDKRDERGQRTRRHTEEDEPQRRLAEELGCDQHVTSRG